VILRDPAAVVKRRGEPAFLWVNEHPPRVEHLQSNFEIKMSSNGSGGAGNPLGVSLARMGIMSMATAVRSVETGALNDDLFAPAAAYKLNQKK